MSFLSRMLWGLLFWLLIIAISVFPPLLKYVEHRDDSFTLNGSQDYE